MRASISLLLTGLLAACAHDTPPKMPEIRYVERPVPVPCIQKQRLPARPKNIDKPIAGGNDALATAEILERAEQTREYTLKLEAEMKGCTN